METRFALLGNSITEAVENQEKSGEKQENFELVTYERIWNATINSMNGDGSLGLLFDAYVVYLIMDFCQFYETPFR